MKRMLHPINGRVGFDRKQPSEAARAAIATPSAGLRVTPALAIAMLTRESKLRLTPDVSLVLLIAIQDIVD